MKRFTIALLFVVAIGFTTTSCRETNETEIEMENAGDEMENDLEEAGEDMENAAENAGEEIENVGEEMEAEIEDEDDM